MAGRGGKENCRSKGPTAKGPERMWRDREMVSGLVWPGLRAGVGKSWRVCAECPDRGVTRELNWECH